MIARTADRSSAPTMLVRASRCSPPLSWSIPSTATPGSAPAAGSTSRGIARSSRTSGPPAARWATAAAPVQEMTRSASAMASVRPARSATCPPTLAASRSARSRVRLATTTRAAPSRAAVATARPLIAPAPTTRTRRPAKLVAPRAGCMPDALALFGGSRGSPPWASSASGMLRGVRMVLRGVAPPGDSSSVARSTPTLTSDRPIRSMPVSTRARLPACRATRPRSRSARPSVPCSSASLMADRTWPMIWSSPTTIESRPLATASRCATARSS